MPPHIAVAPVTMAARRAPHSEADPVHTAVCDLLAPRLDHLLGDFGTWMVTIEVAADATAAACPVEGR